MTSIAGSHPDTISDIPLLSHNDSMDNKRYTLSALKYDLSAELEPGMRRTKDEMETMEGWETSIPQRDSNLAADTYLEQRVIQIAQPLMQEEAQVLVPYEVRMSPCGEYIEWRGQFTWGPYLINQVMKKHVSSAKSLREFVLLSGEKRNTNGRKEGVKHERIVEFVEKWGPLDLYPEIHSADTMEDELHRGAWIAEPVALYREHAKRIWGLLAVAARVNQDEEPTTEEWNAAEDGLVRPDPHDIFGSNVNSLNVLIKHHYMYTCEFKAKLIVKKNRPLLTLAFSSDEEIEKWYADRGAWIRHEVSAEVRKLAARGLETDAKALQVEAEKRFRPANPYPSKLLNSLVLQLLSSVTGGLYRCSLCTIFYKPTRKPRGENRFCHDCQPLAHRKRSKASYQARKGRSAS